MTSKLSHAQSNNDIMYNQNTLLDTNKYVDMMMTSLMLQSATNANATEHWCIMIIKFIAISSSDEIKKLLKYILELLSTNTKSFITSFIAMVTSYLTFIFSNNKITSEQYERDIDITIEEETIKDIDNDVLKKYMVINKSFIHIFDEFYKYLNKNGKFTKTIVTIENNQDKTIDICEIYDNITIPFEDIFIEVLQPIEVYVKNTDKGNNVISLNSVCSNDNQNNKKLFNYDQILSFVDILPIDIKRAVIGIRDEIATAVKSTNNCMGIFDCESKLFTSPNLSYFNIDILISLKQTNTASFPILFIRSFLNKCSKIQKNTDKMCAVYEILIFLSLRCVDKYGEVKIFTILRTIAVKTRKVELFGYTFDINSNESCYTGGGDLTDFRGAKTVVPKFEIDGVYKHIDIGPIYDEYVKCVHEKNVRGVNNVPIIDKTNKNQIIVNLYSNKYNYDNVNENDCDMYLEYKQKIYTKYLAFLKMLSSTKNIKDPQNKKITIYSLSVNYEKITKTKPNPEFEKYEEKKRLLKELNNPSNLDIQNEYEQTQQSEQITNDISNDLSNNLSNTTQATNDSINKLQKKIKKNKNNMFYHDPFYMFLMNPPEKEIIETELKPEVKVKQINTKYKSIERLYLKEKDKKKLMTCLNNFHLRKDIMEDLDIQNKFGFILYGEPGCGKTTTIMAIASYLKKDIYYVNLNTVKTNEALSLVFDYVAKCCSNNGIIIFEDIDATCPIVLAREYTLFGNEKTHIKELNVNDLIELNSQELTLEYFLNILQGVLTQDGIIYGVTTNHYDKLDKAFVRDGRFDVKINMTLCDHYQIKKIFEDFIKREIDNDVLQKIPEYTFTPVSIIMRCSEFIVDTDSSDEEIMEIFIK